MRVRVLYYAMLRDMLGRSEEMLDLEPGARVRDVLHAVRGARQEKVWSVVVAAVNDTWAGMDAVVADGDEVSLMPPVSGGGW